MIKIKTIEQFVCLLNFMIQKLKLLLYIPLILLGCTPVPEEITWNYEVEILKRIIPPSFPEKEYDITKYGAVNDGKTDCTDAFKKAIEKCSDAGGGRVIVPEGLFLTGAIHLKSNVNLYVSKNAVIKFSSEPSKYLPVVFTRWEGVECMNYSPLIYAYEQENIAVTGEGLLDGSGSNENWWSWCGKDTYGWKEGMPNQKEGRKKLMEMGQNNVPVEQRVFGDGFYLRPSFFQPYKCKNILVESVTFKNSPMWFLNPVLCENTTIRNITVEGLGPNNDGCDPECSKNTLIENCFFNTGDDCIAIKSGRNNDGRRINTPTENIVIRGCKMKEGHGGVVVGSEISGGVRNVFVSNCEMDSPNLDRALRFKTNSIRGGVTENYFARDIKVGQVKEAILHINYFYEEGDAGSFIPVMKNIHIKNITSNKSPYAIWIKAYRHSPVKNIIIENCKFNNVKNENIIENVENLKFIDVFVNEKQLANN